MRKILGNMEQGGKKIYPLNRVTTSGKKKLLNTRERKRVLLLTFYQRVTAKQVYGFNSIAPWPAAEANEA